MWGLLGFTVLCDGGSCPHSKREAWVQGKHCTKLWQPLLHGVWLGQVLPGSELSWGLLPWSWKTSAGSYAVFWATLWVLFPWKSRMWLPWTEVYVRWSQGMCKVNFCSFWGGETWPWVQLTSKHYIVCLLGDSTLPGKGGSRNTAAVGADL